MPKIPQKQPEPTITIDNLESRIFGIYDRLLDHEHCVPDVVLAPANADGSPDWERTDPANVVALTADQWPDTESDARRVCVIISNIDGCHPDSSFILTLHPETGIPGMFQIHGESDDRIVADAIIGRDLGNRPKQKEPSRLQESMDKLVAEMARQAPVAANDNRPAVQLPAMHPDPFSPDAAGGILSMVSKWITSTAIIPVPELSLASSIALLAGIFGKVALTPTRAGVNVYLTTLLGTAGGKGWPAKAIRTLADQPGTAGAVTNGDPTSYAALERILRKQSSTVVVMDEFGITLQDVNAKHKNSVAAGIRKFLLAVYDQSNSVFDGRVYASSETKKDEAPIVGPALTVLGMTTVDTLYAGLSEASVADGFLNRFLFVTAAPPSGTITPPSLDYELAPPKDILAALSEARSAFPKKVAGKFVVPMEGGQDGAAYRRWGEVFIWQQSDKSELAGRAAENTIRLATLRAISRDPGGPTVNLDDVEWGWAIVHSSIQLIAGGVREHMSASPAEALRKAVMAALKDAPDGVPYSKLVTKRGISGANSRELADALTWLRAADEIVDINGKPFLGAGSKFRSKST
ncbi:MAG: DUF3987 domain-containing protein [Allorhizobium sp.]